MKGFPAPSIKPPLMAIQWNRVLLLVIVFQWILYLYHIASSPSTTTTTTTNEFGGKKNTRVHVDGQGDDSDDIHSVGDDSGVVVGGDVAVVAAESSLHRPTFKFYIYEELNNVDPGNCYAESKCSKLYYCVERTIYRALRNHPARTMDGEEAQLFVIPFSGPASSYSGKCNGTTHKQRMENVVGEFFFFSFFSPFDNSAATLKKSPFFQRKKGADHYWPNLWWVWCKGDYQYEKDGAYELATAYLYNHHISEGGLLENIIFGRYIRQVREQREREKKKKILTDLSLFFLNRGLLGCLLFIQKTFLLPTTGTGFVTKIVSMTRDTILTECPVELC